MNPVVEAQEKQRGQCEVGVSEKAIRIEDILVEGNARARLQQLVAEGIPEDLLKETLIRYANCSDERLPLIPGMKREQVEKLETDAIDIASRIKRANESAYTDPILRTPPSPWPGRHLAPIFLELPAYLILFALHIDIWLHKVPSSVFDSERQHIELTLAAMSLHFTGEKNYAAIADLLTAALDAADEFSDAKRVSRAALLQLVKDHPEEVELAKQQLASLGFPASKPTR